MIQIKSVLLLLAFPQLIWFIMGLCWLKWSNWQPMITVIEIPDIFIYLIMHISLHNSLMPLFTCIWVLIDVISLIYLIAYHHEIIHPHKHDLHISDSIWKQAIKRPELKIFEIILAILYVAIGLISIIALINDQTHYRSSIMSHDIGTFRVIDSDNNSDDVNNDGEAPRGEALDQVKINKHQIKGYNADHQLIMIYNVKSYRYSEDHEGLIMRGKYQLAKEHVATKGKNTTDNTQYHFRPFKAGILLGYKKGHAYISTQGTNDDKYMQNNGRYRDTDTHVNTPFGGNDSNESHYSYKLEK